MFLTLETTHQPATDLGFLVGKQPDKVQSFGLSFGTAHIFYPIVSPERCQMALMVEVDPIALVRGRHNKGKQTQYVNDRPYVACSFLSVALSKVLGSALRGRCKDKPELARKDLPWKVCLPTLPAPGGEKHLRDLFEPLGYTLTTVSRPLSKDFPEWGDHRALSVTLENTCTLSALLSHLYVLIPVLDGDKHYWVGDEEIDKLLEHGEPWLQDHPEREQIVRRYLKHQGGLARRALGRLREDSEAEPDPVALEAPVRLNELRLSAVVDELKALSARSVLDLGCGEGKLLKMLLAEASVERVLGVDVSIQVLQRAKRRLERAPEHLRSKVVLAQGSAVYRDERFEGFDVLCAVEVIEHLDPWRLDAFARVVFGHAKPGAVVLTTPNREYNVLFEGMVEGKMRHRDHRFEWTRAEFEAWCGEVAVRFGYRVRFVPVGSVHDEFGAPTQMGVFQR